MGDFDLYLKKRKTKHLFSYTRKINGFIERANRSLNEEFIQKNIHEVNEIDRFNINMMEHLIWFNALRPHHSLNNLSSIQFMVKSNLISHMYGTYTID